MSINTNGSNNEVNTRSKKSIAILLATILTLPVGVCSSNESVIQPKNEEDIYTDYSAFIATQLIILNKAQLEKVSKKSLTELVNKAIEFCKDQESQAFDKSSIIVSKYNNSNTHKDSEKAYNMYRIYNADTYSKSSLYKKRFYALKKKLDSNANITQYELEKAKNYIIRKQKKLLGQYITITIMWDWLLFEL